MIYPGFFSVSKDIQMTLVERVKQRVYRLYHSRCVLAELQIVTNRNAWVFERDLSERCSKFRIDPAGILT